MAAVILLDEAAHTYTVGGKQVPGVSEILAGLTNFSMVPDDCMEAAQLRGLAVHKATELWDLGTLDEESVDPAIAGYLNGWKRFRADTCFVPTHIETRLHHEMYGYCGTLDRVGTCRVTPAGAIDLIDIKTTAALYPSVGPQTAAYMKALLCQDKTLPPICSRAAVLLRADGTYRHHPCTDRDDFSVFLAALTLYSFNRKHRIKQ